MNCSKELSTEIRKRIARSGKTYEQIAETLGCSVRVVYDWCNGHKIPRGDKVYYILTKL